MQNTNVIKLNTDTILFSFQPDNSKWWCIGVILKILFPVLLKYKTCIITDIVSITGINAITGNNNGSLRYKAIVDITPPK